MTPPRSFSDHLRQIIENRGASRYALAAKAGVSGATLSHFVSGRQNLTL